MIQEEKYNNGESLPLIENNLSSVKLIRNSKGYNWEIKVYDSNPEIAMNTTIDIDERLKVRYGGT